MALFRKWPQRLMGSLVAEAYQRGTGGQVHPGATTRAVGVAHYSNVLAGIVQGCRLLRSRYVVGLPVNLNEVDDGTRIPTHRAVSVARYVAARPS